MRKLVTAGAAATLALGLGAAAPTPAAANPVLIAPAWLAVTIVGSVAAGALVGATAANAGYWGPAAGPPPGPSPSVYVTDEPSAAGCYFTHAQVHGAWRRVQVCD